MFGVDVTVSVDSWFKQSKNARFSFYRLAIDKTYATEKNK